MKIRQGFVSNSSSSSFIVVNKTNILRTLVDFVKENPQLAEEFKKKYNWYADRPDMTQDALLISAYNNNISFEPGPNNVSFSDDIGVPVESMLRYMLRDDGSSENFEWSYVGDC